MRDIFCSMIFAFIFDILLSSFFAYFFEFFIFFWIYNDLYFGLSVWYFSPFLCVKVLTFTRFSAILYIERLIAFTYLTSL